MLSIDKFQKVTGIHITTKHNGKMSGLASISTSSLKNQFCINRAKNPDSICAHCYANSMQNQYSNLANCIAKNFDILTTEILPLENLPLIPYIYFRFESFGDTYNAIQLENYNNIALVNPQTKFAIWTKNVAIFNKFYRDHKKPENLQIIVSSPFLNKVLNIDKFPWADKVFTVFDKETISKKSININCGARNCFECHKCYTANGVHYVNEKLK